MENAKELSLKIESYFRYVLNLKTRPIGQIFDSDCIMVGTFYECMETIIKKYDIQDEFLKKYEYIKNIPLNKIENADKIFLEFKDLLKNIEL